MFLALSPSSLTYFLLMVHALVLPMSTSTMKRVKTDLRNRMNTQTLDGLLRVRLEAPTDQVHTGPM